MRIKKRSKILGICLGLQLGKSSEEDGGCMGLNLVNNEVKKINSSKVKVPMLDLMPLALKRRKKIFSGLKNKSDFYFNHSYCMSEVENETTTSTRKLDGEFISSLSKKKNTLRRNFHPEKSQSNGLVFLKNFYKVNINVKKNNFTLLLKDDQFVLSRNFRLQKVGDANWLEKNYNFKYISRFIDELIILNVFKKKDINPFFGNIVKKAIGQMLRSYFLLEVVLEVKKMQNYV